MRQTDADKNYLAEVGNQLWWRAPDWVPSSTCHSSDSCGADVRKVTKCILSNTTLLLEKLLNGRFRGVPQATL